VTHLIDRPRGINRIEISSDAPLGVIDFWDGERLETIETKALTHVVPGDDPGPLLRVRTGGTPILDRENVVLSLRPQGRPRRIDLRLASDERYILFDSNYPVIQQESGAEYTIMVGNYPPNPLELELTLPQDREFTLLVQMEYEEPPFRFEVSGANKRVSTRLLVRTDHTFSTTMP
jgi:hypothetical protein